MSKQNYFIWITFEPIFYIIHAILKLQVTLVFANVVKETNTKTYRSIRTIKFVLDITLKHLIRPSMVFMKNVLWLFKRLNKSPFIWQNSFPDIWSCLLSSFWLLKLFCVAKFYYTYLSKVLFNILLQKCYFTRFQ